MILSRVDVLCAGGSCREVLPGTVEEDRMRLALCVSQCPVPIQNQTHVFQRSVRIKQNIVSGVLFSVLDIPRV